MSAQYTTYVFYCGSCGIPLDADSRCTNSSCSQFGTPTIGYAYRLTNPPWGTDMNYGWTCPNCKAGVAPWVNMCPRCQQITQISTHNTDEIKPQETKGAA